MAVSIIEDHWRKIYWHGGYSEKNQLAKENGADSVINYREEKDLVNRVKEITGGHGVDVVFDGVGKDQTENNVKVVAKDGTIVTYGVAVC